MSGGVDDHFLSPKGDPAALVFKKGSGPFRTGFDVGLITAHIPIGEDSAAELDPGITSHHAVIEFQVEVCRLAATPDEVMVFKAGSGFGALGSDGAVLDVPLVRLAMPS